MAVIAVYANTLDVPFFFDDQPAIVRNQSIRQLWPLTEALSPPLDAAGATGRPLVNLSLATNYALSGLDVRGYHLFNLGVHLFNTLLLWGLIRRTLSLGLNAFKVNESFAWCSALLWAIHPLLTESVTYTVQRTELIVGFFYLLTFYSFARSLTSASSMAKYWQITAVLACLLGTASKEVIATAPLLILLYDRTFASGSFKQAWRRRGIFYVVLAFTWVALAWLMLSANQRNSTAGFGVGLSSWEYLVTQARAVALYLKLSVWPQPLVVDYGFVTYKLNTVLPEAVLVVTLLAATLWALIKHPVWGFLGAAFFIILAPTSSVVPIVTQTIAEHRMYLPLIAVILIFVSIGIKPLGRFAVPACTTLALILSLVSWQRNQIYRDERLLWDKAINAQPKNERLYASLGYYHMRKGEWPEAIVAYEVATRLQPNFADAQSDLGSAFLEAGRHEEALSRHAKAVHLKPTDPVIRFNYAQALERVGQIAAAIAQWKEALRLQPTLAPAWRQLATTFATQGLLNEAIDYYEKAIHHDPADIDAYSGLGDVFLKAGKLPAAVGSYEKAIARRPDIAELHYNLGNIHLAMNESETAGKEYAEAVRLKPEFTLARHNLAFALTRGGRAQEAIPLYEQAVLEMPDSAQIHYNLAIALEQTGDLKGAIEHDRKALQLNPGYTAASEHLRRLLERSSALR